MSAMLVSPSLYVHLYAITKDRYVGYFDEGGTSLLLHRKFSHNSVIMADTQEVMPQREDHAAKRRWPRFFVDMAVQVRVKTQGPTKIHTWQAQGGDISCGGLAVTVAADLPIGSQIGVEFALPKSNRLMSFRCFVRNRDGQRYGLEFITENDEDYARAADLQRLLGCNIETLSE